MGKILMTKLTKYIHLCNKKLRIYILVKMRLKFPKRCFIITHRVTVGYDEISLSGIRTSCDFRKFLNLNEVFQRSLGQFALVYRLVSF